VTPPTVDPALLDIAIDLGRRAGELTLQWFRDPALEIEMKGDGSPVTAADRAAETFIREELGRRCPGDAVLGEELDDTVGTTGRTWSIDPIDGTYPFTKGVPLYSSLLAMSDEHGPAIGVITIPALGEQVSAGRGLGARHNGQPCRVSDTDSLSGACVTTSAYTWWPNVAVAKLHQQGPMMQAWGDGYGFLMVATGRADAMIDFGLNPWDIAPMHVIISEAGGTFTGTDGESAADTGNVIASNGRLHNALIDVFAT
jgi:histidinol-phosphatase